MKKVLHIVNLKSKLKIGGYKKVSKILDNKLNTPFPYTKKMALLFEDLANFLATPPEFIENWVSTPAKEMQSQKDQPSIDLPEFVVSFFKILPIDHFGVSLKLNRDWYKECRRELENRRNACIVKYWDTVEEYKEANKDLNESWKTQLPWPERCQYFDKSTELAKKKTEDFGAWIEVDLAILRCGLLELIDHINPKYYINMYLWGLDPYEIPSPGNDPEGILDYWGDEDLADVAGDI